ncbi:hypothetical protein MJO29_001508 [Puccinia striiformis f. sp. tritici]|nr:hypothetical protein MJO29_001508 [Puccinia striiformis f. sp. tritici]
MPQPCLLAFRRSSSDNEYAYADTSIAPPGVAVPPPGKQAGPVVVPPPNAGPNPPPPMKEAPAQKKPEPKKPDGPRPPAGGDGKKKGDDQGDRSSASKLVGISGSVFSTCLIGIVAGIAITIA